MAGNADELLTGAGSVVNAIQATGEAVIVAPVWLRYGGGLASITLKGIPEDLHYGGLSSWREKVS